MDGSGTELILTGGDELTTRLEQFQNWSRGAYASETERALKNDIRLFTGFCASRGLSPLPASGETVALFLAEVATTRALATLRRYLASIATFHKAAGVVSPTLSMEVKLTMKRLAREKGVRQKQAAPINRPLVERMVEKGRETLRDARDLAMVALAYDTLCRRSELVALNVEDFTFALDGSGTVLIRRSKTDQEGEGMVRFVAPDTCDLVKRWLGAAGIAEGPAFRGVNNSDEVLERLHPQGVARAFKRLAGLAGEGGVVERISGHSARVGSAQDMVAAGIDVSGIMQAGGWKNPTMVARYSQNLSARRGAAARLAFLQNRM